MPGVGPCLGRRILVSVPTGFQLRQFVHSGVLDRLLARGFRILIVTPGGKEEGFAATLPKEGVDVRTFTSHLGRLRHRYWTARQHLFVGGPSTDTLRRKMVDLQRQHPGVAWAARAANQVLVRFPWLHRRALRWEHLILRDRALDALLATETVDLILLGSPGYMAQDALLLHAGVRRRIPVAAAVLSWDNLSSKGFMNPQPDRLLVWSEHMRREAIELHHMPPERIVVTGAPHYDIYANARRFGSRSENLRHLGLDPTRRLIVYGTNHKAHFPDEIEVVKRVAQWVEEESLGTPCQLWVRLHPQAVAGPYEVLTHQYRELASERVRIEFPPVQDSRLLWDLPQSDLTHLVRLLRDADVVINTASTLAIDAAIVDRPVVSVAYDPAGLLPYERSVRRYYDYTHMSHVVRAGAVQLGTSPQELRQKIVAYLERPALDREGRRRIVEQQFGKVDGLSVMRLVDQIAAMVSMPAWSASPVGRAGDFS